MSRTCRTLGQPLVLGDARIAHATFALNDREAGNFLRERPERLALRTFPPLGHSRGRFEEAAAAGRAPVRPYLGGEHLLQGSRRETAKETKSGTMNGHRHGDGAHSVRVVSQCAVHGRSFVEPPLSHQHS